VDTVDGNLRLQLLFEIYCFFVYSLVTSIVFYSVRILGDNGDH
jgi:hypothetical protein